MNTMILSVAVGGGHGHAANAIKNKILQKEPDSKVEIIDTIKVINPVLDKVIVGSYLQSLKISPSIFEKLYKSTDVDTLEDTGFTYSVLSKFNQIIASRISELIKDWNPDLLIATHPFSANIISCLKLEYNISCPAITVLTDYAPHATWLHPGTDAYIVSNKDMKNEMVERGIDKKIIYPLGIPIENNFLKKFDRVSTLKKYNLDPNRKTITLMGGSLGLGNISDIYKKFIKEQIDVQLIVICGTNKKLYNKLIELKETYTHDSSRILGYTQDVNKIMQASDLLLTKPGGLTITEALICELPMAIISKLPGQEVRNIEFLTKHNLAIDLVEDKYYISTIKKLIESDSKLISMKRNCQNFSKPNSAEDIYKLLKSLLDNSKGLSPVIS
ncbi:MGDG synthase family glycosyltransferase [Clostridium cellulovorans]|uniref:Monogalactosyldiacylglycerol synthase n=2 Tax=Clostridium cellulovorans TaxID=1493 RepID=D9STP2_CLOC7|nr:glycosyltransferase [Clostridium cellulovorans]ADL52776.1 Monogalactosyldiacylglycerol synthase [Clostridium cellulovorans 743B]